MKKGFYNLAVFIMLAATIVYVGFADDIDSDFSMVQKPGYRAASHVNFDSKEVGRAVKFAGLASLAYDAKSSNQTKLQTYNAEVRELEKEGYSLTTFNGDTGHSVISDIYKKNSMLGIYAEKGDELVISFRGTKSKQDVLTDISVLNANLQKSKFNGQEKGKVHAGFNKVFESYKDDLSRQVISSISNGRKKIQIVGYSMGGALANLTALHLSQVAKSMGFHDVEIKVLTFNAPRVGSKNFADKLNTALGLENNARLTKGKREGIASAVPGSAGFKHAGTNVVVDGESGNKIEDHKFSGFRNGAAEKAVIDHNNDPKKANGILSSLREKANNAKEAIKNGFARFFGRAKPAAY